MNADPIVLEPGSAEWLREMTASKVAAVLGLSPWESRFSLWYRMAGLAEAQPGTATMTRGHYLEDGVARWLADQYGLGMREGGCWRNIKRPWQVASPDRLGGPRGQLPYAAIPLSHVDSVVEVKTATDWEPWGPDGSDEVPAYYRVQAVWQMDTLGVDTCYMGVLLPRLELRGYVLHPAPGEAEFIREECRAFLDSLAAGDPPDVDKHDQTYAVLRELHPRINGGQVTVSPAEAAAFATAVVRYRDAENEFNLERSLMAQRMGDAKEAVCDERIVALRSPAPKTGVPYVAATRSKRTLADFAALHPTTEEN